MPLRKSMEYMFYFYLIFFSKLFLSRKWWIINSVDPDQTAPPKQATSLQWAELQIRGNRDNLGIISHISP